MFFYMLLFRIYHLITIINNMLNNFSIKQGEVSTFPVGTRRTHTNSTHSREYYIQWMSRRRKSNVMHLPSLQPSSCSLLTPDLLIPVTTHHQTSAYYNHVLREQSVILTVARGTSAESCMRPLRCAKKAGATRSGAFLLPEPCVTHAAVTSPQHCWTAGQRRVNPLLAHGPAM